MKRLVLYIADSTRENLSVKRILRENRIRCLKPHRIKQLPSQKNIERTKCFVYFNHAHDDIAKVFADNGAEIIFINEFAPTNDSNPVVDIKTPVAKENSVETPKKAKKTASKKVK